LVRGKMGAAIGEHCRRHIYAALKAQNEKERTGSTPRETVAR